MGMMMFQDEGIIRKQQGKKEHGNRNYKNSVWLEYYSMMCVTGFSESGKGLVYHAKNKTIDKRGTIEGFFF